MCTSQIFIHDCTMVTPFPLLFFGGDVTASKVCVLCVCACVCVCVCVCVHVCVCVYNDALDQQYTHTSKIWTRNANCYIT